MLIEWDGQAEHEWRQQHEARVTARIQAEREAELQEYRRRTGEAAMIGVELRLRHAQREFYRTRMPQYARAYPDELERRVLDERRELATMGLGSCPDDELRQRLAEHRRWLDEYFVRHFEWDE